MYIKTKLNKTTPKNKVDIQCYLKREHDTVYYGGRSLIKKNRQTWFVPSSKLLVLTLISSILDFCCCWCVVIKIQLQGYIKCFHEQHYQSFNKYMSSYIMTVTVSTAATVRYLSCRLRAHRGSVSVNLRLSCCFFLRFGCVEDLWNSFHVPVLAISSAPVILTPFLVMLTHHFCLNKVVCTS